MIAAVNRSLEKKKAGFSEQQLDLLQQYLSQPKQQPAKIAVAVASGLEIIQLSDIMYLEATGNYTNIHFASGKPLLSSKTLKEFEELLSSTQFCRIHNGSLVNVSFIKKYNKGEGGQVVLNDGTLLDVARRRKEELLQLLQQQAPRI